MLVSQDPGIFPDHYEQGHSVLPDARDVCCWPTTWHEGLGPGLRWPRWASILDLRP